MLVQEIVVLLAILLGFGGLRPWRYYLRPGTADDPYQITVMSETANMKKARAFVSADVPHTAMQH